MYSLALSHMFMHTLDSSTQTYAEQDLATHGGELDLCIGPRRQVQGAVEQVAQRYGVNDRGRS